MAFSATPNVEPFRRDSAQHYTDHIETGVLVDPFWVQVSHDPISEAIALKSLMRYAHRVSTPTKIRLLYPTYLEPKKAMRYGGSVLPGDTVLIAQATPAEEDDLPSGLHDLLVRLGRVFAEQRASLKAAAPKDEEALFKLVGGSLDLPPRVVPHPMLVPAPVEGREGRASSGTRATA